MIDVVRLPAGRVGIGWVVGGGGVRGWGRGLGGERGGAADASQRRRYAGKACDRDGHATVGEPAGRFGNRRHGWGKGDL